MTYLFVSTISIVYYYYFLFSFLYQSLLWFLCFVILGIVGVSKYVSVCEFFFSGFVLILWKDINLWVSMDVFQSYSQWPLIILVALNGSRGGCFLMVCVFGCFWLLCFITVDVASAFFMVLCWFCLVVCFSWVHRSSMELPVLGLLLWRFSKCWQQRCLPISLCCFEVRKPPLVLFLCSPSSRDASIEIFVQIRLQFWVFRQYLQRRRTLFGYAYSMFLSWIWFIQIWSKDTLFPVLFRIPNIVWLWEVFCSNSRIRIFLI